jgi:hypothetical protein
MESRFGVFNGFLVLALLALTAGCATSEERKKRNEVSTLRVHVEADRGATDRNSAISIHRTSPILLNIDREPVLDEREVQAAMVVDQPGGFAIEVQFDRRGSWILERTSVMHRGKHFAIFSHFGEKNARWLAAPLITAKNSSGRLVFTPDATREEAERIVRGLNNFARKRDRKDNFPFREPIDR